jgi:hypothetical protein
MKRVRAIWTSIWSWCLRLFGRLRGHDGHPTPELLAAYHEDRLPPEKDGEIQEHFVECPECPELVLSLDEFASKEVPVTVMNDLSDTRVDWAWRRLRGQLLREITVPRIPRPRLLWLKRPALAWGMVGVLLPSTAGLGIQVRSLMTDLQLLEKPEIAPPSTTILLPSVTRSAEQEPAGYEVPPGAPRFLLKLESPAEEALPAYRLVIRTAHGQDVWAGDGLTRTEEGMFEVRLTRRFLPAGDYKIRVLGIEQGQERVVQDYPVRLSYL